MAEQKIDMSLDDIIKMSKKRRSFDGADRGDRKKPRRSAPYPQQNFRRQNNRRSDTLKRSPEPDVWRHDMYQDEPLAQPPKRTNFTSRSGNTTVLRISNLHYNVSEEDIKELFKDFGSLVKSTLFYDRSGRSTGVAEIEYRSRQEALNAQRRYNKVPLDGQQMDIVIKEDNPKSDLSSRLGSRSVQNFIRGGRGGQGGQARKFQGRQGPRAARQEAPVRERRQDLTREQLDAELDSYLSKGVESEPMME